MIAARIHHRLGLITSATFHDGHGPAQSANPFTARGEASILEPRDALPLGIQSSSVAPLPLGIQNQGPLVQPEEKDVAVGSDRDAGSIGSERGVGHLEAQAVGEGKSGNEHGGRSIDQPLGTVTTRDRFAVVDSDRMRMLSIQECRIAMGFPDTYWLPPEHRVAMHLLGNAVCPPVAAGILSQLN